MRKLFLGLKFSFSYFSILPIKFKSSDNLGDKVVLSYMLVFFPFVGIVLAEASVLVGLALERVGFLAWVIASLFYMVLYGFLHTEAICDVVDGIYAKHSGKDAYEVLKEPTVGALGVLWSCSFVILKVSTLATLLSLGAFVEFLGVVVASRVVLLVLIRSLKFRSSFVNKLKEASSNRVFFYVALFCLGLCCILGLEFLVILSFSIVFGFLIAKAISKKLGFANGDLLGSTLEIVEVILFLGVLLWL